MRPACSTHISAQSNKEPSMVKEFTHSARHIQDLRLQEWSALAREDALRREARALRRLRRALGYRLIAIGERMIEPRSPVDQPFDAAA